ncbi:MAG: response regulator [Sphingobacteriaceae bacterium]|nr:response regulator [Sphingobacteriaceae bacterium]
MKTILCVDDDQDILDTFSIILASEGYKVECLIDPSDIFRVIEGCKPALIFMDINMEGVNGLEVCRALGSNANTLDIPVIIVSSDPRIDSAINDYGATDILLKPFTIKELLDTVDYYLGSRIISLFPEEKL